MSRGQRSCNSCPWWLHEVADFSPEAQSILSDQILRPNSRVYPGFAPTIAARVKEVLHLLISDRNICCLPTPGLLEDAGEQLAWRCVAPGRWGLRAAELG